MVPEPSMPADPVAIATAAAAVVVAVADVGAAIASVAAVVAACGDAVDASAANTVAGCIAIGGLDGGVVALVMEVDDPML